MSTKSSFLKSLTNFFHLATHDKSASDAMTWADRHSTRGLKGEEAFEEMKQLSVKFLLLHKTLSSLSAEGIEGMTDREVLKCVESYHSKGVSSTQKAISELDKADSPKGDGST